MVTIPMLAQTFRLLLEALNLDPGLYILHSLRRGGAMAAYKGGLDQLDIRCHGLWVTNALGLYVTTTAVVNSPVVATLAATMDWGSYIACIVTKQPQWYTPPPTHTPSPCYSLATHQCCSGPPQELSSVSPAYSSVHIHPSSVYNLHLCFGPSICYILPDLVYIMYVCAGYLLVIFTCHPCL